jgi:molybdopterin-guanine dinucleotide biosynthesis protein
MSRLSDKIDLAFVEGFRGLDVPEILCVENLGDIPSQLNLNIKMISGVISTKIEKINSVKDIPIINIEKQFQRFLEIFDIRQK